MAHEGGAEFELIRSGVGHFMWRKGSEEPRFKCWNRACWCQLGSLRGIEGNWHVWTGGMDVA